MEFTILIYTSVWFGIIYNGEQVKPRFISSLAAFQITYVQALFACLRCAAADTMCPHEPPFGRLGCPNFEISELTRKYSYIIKLNIPFYILDALKNLLCHRRNINCII